MTSRPNQDWRAPLLPWMIEAMATMGFEKMTPVQAATIPLLAGNKDVVVEAVTGSGKTLAFVLPALVRLSKLEPLQMGQTNIIVISPTRELAQQTFKVLNSLIELAPGPALYKTQLITGGNTSTNIADIKSYLSKRPHVIVATPGRLLDLLNAQHVKTNAVDLLVLDEADRLLDLGIAQTINKILGLLPKQKRVGLFSATMSDMIEDIIRVGMRNPVKVSVKSSHATPQNLSLRYATVGSSDRIPRALGILRDTEFKKAIVYLPTCTSVTYWYQVFSQFLPIKADDENTTKIFSMHGKLLQATRVKTLSNFTDYLDRCILLTTDVAARGLDIPDVDFVLQLDPPTDPNMFVHRAGRTARAGRSGTSVVILNDDLEQSYVDFMNVRKVPLVEFTAPEAPDNYLPKLQAWVKEDRARHDLAVRSFLSYIRFYGKHTATSIFRIDSLDLVEIAKSYGILRLPRMPELRDKVAPEGGYLIDDFDMDSYKYVDPQQEKARLAKVNTGPTPAELEARRKAKERNSVAWSAKLDRKDEAAKRREKRLKRGISKKEQDATNADSSDSDVEQDWKELVQAKKKKRATAEPMFDL